MPTYSPTSQRLLDLPWSFWSSLSQHPRWDAGTCSNLGCAFATSLVGVPPMLGNFCIISLVFSGSIHNNSGCSCTFRGEKCFSLHSMQVQSQCDVLRENLEEVGRIATICRTSLYALLSYRNEKLTMGIFSSLCFRSQRALGAPGQLCDWVGWVEWCVNRCVAHLHGWYISNLDAIFSLKKNQRMCVCVCVCIFLVLIYNIWAELVLSYFYST